MKVVVDTNVMVSTILTPTGPPAQILDLIVTHRITLFVTLTILKEYREVLRRREFAFDKEAVQDFLQFIESYASVGPEVPLTRSLPDPKDESFLQCPSEDRLTFSLREIKNIFLLPFVSPFEWFHRPNS